MDLTISDRVRASILQSGGYKVVLHAVEVQRAIAEQHHTNMSLVRHVCHELRTERMEALRHGEKLLAETDPNRLARLRAERTRLALIMTTCTEDTLGCWVRPARAPVSLNLAPGQAFPVENPQRPGAFEFGFGCIDKPGEIQWFDPRDLLDMLPLLNWL